MTISALPTPPSRSDSPGDFATKADAFLGALPTFATEANALAGDVNADAAAAAGSASNAATQAGIATTQAGNASISAGNAATSAQLADNWANKTTGTVDGSEYSAKEYAIGTNVPAGSAKDWAIQVGSTVDGSEYSAKHYSQEAAQLTERYQGALSTDPTLDKTGNPLTAGDWYVNTVSGFLRVYNGTSWVQGVSAVSGVSSINGETGDVVDFVKLATTQTLTNKTIEAANLTNGYTEEVFAVTGTTPALSPTNGSIQTWTLSGNSTPTTGTWVAGQSITLMIDDGTNRTINWTSVAPVWKTDGGSAPTLNTTGFTAIALWKVGTVIYGARVGDA